MGLCFSSNTIKFIEIVKKCDIDLPVNYKNNTVCKIERLVEVSNGKIRFGTFQDKATLLLVYNNNIIDIYILGKTCRHIEDSGTGYSVIKKTKNSQLCELYFIEKQLPPRKNYAEYRHLLYNFSDTFPDDSYLY